MDAKDHQLLMRVVEDDHLAVLKAAFHMRSAVEALDDEDVTLAKGRALLRYSAWLRSNGWQEVSS